MPPKPPRGDVATLSRALGGDAVDPEDEVLVVVRDHRAVGRGDAVEAQHRPVVGEPFRLSEAVGGKPPPLDLARLVGEGHERLAVGHESGLAVAHPRRPRRLHQPALRGGRDEHLAAGGQHDPVPIGGNARRGEVVDRLVHPPLTELVEVGSERHGQQRVLARGDVEHVEVGAELVDDAPVGKRRGRHVPSLGVGQLAQGLAGLVHRPQVHRAVAVAGEVDAALPDHRRHARARVVAGQGDRLLGAYRELPDLLRHAAAVALGVAPLKRQPGEEQCATGGVVGAVGSLGERHGRARSRARVGGHELNLRQGGEPTRRVEHLAVRRPADDDRLPAVVREPRRETAGERHDVDLGGPLVLGGKRHRGSVGRNGGVGLLPRVAREALGGATRNSHFPEVALGREDHRVAVDRGKAVIAARGLSPRGQRKQECERRNHQREALHVEPSLPTCDGTSPRKAGAHPDPTGCARGPDAPSGLRAGGREPRLSRSSLRPRGAPCRWGGAGNKGMQREIAAPGSRSVAPAGRPLRAPGPAAAASSHPSEFAAIAPRCATKVEN